MLTRVLQRPHKDRLRTCIQTLNCRTLLDDQRLDDLDDALTNKNIDICALQETRRDGFFNTTSKNYSIYTFGEYSGHRGVGVAIHKHYAHLITEARGIPQSDGRLMFVNILLHDAQHPTTLICAYAPTNTSSSTVRKKFYSQLENIANPNTWLIGDFNARVGRKLSSGDSAFGSIPSNTVGPWSLKDDVTPNSNGSLLLHIVSLNELIECVIQSVGLGVTIVIVAVRCLIMYSFLRHTCVSSLDVLYHQIVHC